MNERIHFFIKVHLSHFILERVMFVRGELETGPDFYNDPSSSDHSSPSFSSWLGLLNLGSLRVPNPLSAADFHFGILSPANSNRLCTWLYYCLTTTCFRLFTQVHLLIDGLVECQYITYKFDKSPEKINRVVYMDNIKGKFRRTNQSTRKLMMHKALHLSDDIDRLFVLRKEGGRGLASIEDCMGSSVRSFEDNIMNTREGRITAANNIIIYDINEIRGDTIANEDFPRRGYCWLESMCLNFISCHHLK